MTIFIWAFAKKISSQLLAIHGVPVMRTASADLASINDAVDADLGDAHAADGDKINGTSLQKNESTFFGVLETCLIGENHPMDENKSIDFLQFVHYKKAQLQKLIRNVVQMGLMQTPTCSR